MNRPTMILGSVAALALGWALYAQHRATVAGEQAAQAAATNAAYTFPANAGMLYARDPFGDAGMSHTGAAVGSAVTTPSTSPPAAARAPKTGIVTLADGRKVGVLGQKRG